MENKVLAVAAGQEITQKDLDALIARYPAEQQRYFATEEGNKRLLDQTIGFELMTAYGKELELDKTKEYEDAMKVYAKEVVMQLAMNKVLSEVEVKEEDLKKYYEDNKDKYAEQATVNAKHILVDTEEEAKKIKTEIDNGEISFEDAAKKYSSCPSNQQGGSLGSFGRGMMVPEFEEAAFNAEIGVVTEPVKTQFGYHLIVVEEKNDAKIKSFEEVKNAVEKEYTNKTQYDKYEEVLNQLEKKYGVERK